MLIAASPWPRIKSLVHSSPGCQESGKPEPSKAGNLVQCYFMVTAVPLTLTIIMPPFMPMTS
ncbi:MAG: hypothetical protein PsegKO_02180 [Pseudohongiellaceae bacterium]|jgi:hypothetical protein